MIIIPDIHPRLKNVIDWFDGAGCPLDASEIVWLAKLREPCDKPIDGGLEWPVGSVLSIGDTDFYPLHRLAFVWWQRADTLFKSLPMRRLKIYAFAHYKSSPGDDSLKRINTVEQINNAVLRWYDSMPIHDGQLPDINQRLNELDGTYQESMIEIEDDEETEPRKIKLMDGISGLMQTFPGTTHKYWTTEISLTELNDLTDDANAEGFATSEPRRAAMARFLTAVKYLKQQKGLADGKAS